MLLITAAFSDIFVRSVAPYKETDRLRLVRENGRPLKGIRFIPSGGHSPGHSSIEFTSQGKRLIFTGDAFMTKVRLVKFSDIYARHVCEHYLGITPKLVCTFVEPSLFL